MSASTTQLTYPDIGVAVAIDVGPDSVVTLKIIPLEATKPAAVVAQATASAPARRGRKPAALVGSVPRKRKAAAPASTGGETPAPRKRGRPRKVQADAAAGATVTAAVPPPLPPPPPANLPEDFEPAA